MNVYFVSGLGADARIFKNIKLPEHCVPVHLPWIEPLRAESLAGYSKRMLAHVDVEQPFALLGLSLGGMIAVEMAKLAAPQTLILLSSIPSAGCLPKYYVVAGWLGLHRILPVSLIKKASLVKRIFSPETREDKRMLRQMIRDCDSGFVHWGMGAIIDWNNRDLPEIFVHIHGSADLILPMRLTKPTHMVKKGSHLMVLNKSVEINAILRSVLA
ncbi:MAG: alpha/beta fold hydrolase [Chitinophagaceae bacterium]